MIGNCHSKVRPATCPESRDMHPRITSVMDLHLAFTFWHLDAKQKKIESSTKESVLYKWINCMNYDMLAQGILATGRSERSDGIKH